MTFPTGVVEIRKCSDEELKTIMLDEAREASKHSRKLDRVMRVVAAHRLRKMRDLLTFEKLATWRRMNGFDRVSDGEDNWFHGSRSLPPTPEEYAPDLRAELNTLKGAISMPRQVSNFINEIEQGKMSDEEFAIFKRLVEKRGREEAHVVVTPVNTVQYCSPRPLNPEIPSDMHVEMDEKDEGKMDPELKELEPPSAGTGLETPGQ